MASWSIEYHLPNITSAHPPSTIALITGFFSIKLAPFWLMMSKGLPPPLPPPPCPAGVPAVVVVAAAEVVLELLLGTGGSAMPFVGIRMAVVGPMLICVEEEDIWVGRRVVCKVDEDNAVLVVGCRELWRVVEGNAMPVVGCTVGRTEVVGIGIGMGICDVVIRTEVVEVVPPPFTQSASMMPPAWTIPSNDLELTIRPEHAACTSAPVFFSAFLQSFEHPLLKSSLSQFAIWRL